MILPFFTALDNTRDSLTISLVYISRSFECLHQSLEIQTQPNIPSMIKEIIFFFKAHFFLFDMQSRSSAVHLFESFAKQLLFPAFPKISMSEELLVSRGTVVTKKQYFSINFRFE